MRDSDQRQYTREWIQRERLQPMYDSFIHRHISVLESEIKDSDQQLLKEELEQYILHYPHSTITGLDQFVYKDLINGCTQFIDNLYMLDINLQSLKNDYRYHWRLNNDIHYAIPGSLISNSNLILSAPFPAQGDIIHNFQEIIKECEAKNISVHLDGAWYLCSRNINLDITSKAIKSIGISLSKTGLAHSRIGIRFSREYKHDSISIMNDFDMFSRPVITMARQFLKYIPSGYLWTKYGQAYDTVISNFNLTPTKCIHTAFDGHNLVGIRPLLRCLQS